jgi:glycosyltransferase involved in cell wall biosynthesis
MREMVDHAQNGYIAKAGDAGAWAEGVRYFVANRDMIPAMGLSSFTKAKQSFSAEKIADEYLTDFRSLIAAGR